MKLLLVIKMVVSEFEYESCIRGYHIYEDMWSSTVGEHLICERETLNLTDRYAVAVLKDDVIIGHLPRVMPQMIDIANMCSLKGLLKRKCK